MRLPGLQLKTWARSIITQHTRSLASSHKETPQNGNIGSHKQNHLPVLPEKALARLKAHLDPLQKKLEHHGLYKSMQDKEDLIHFMENHIFAVWDFMSLLKSLQVALTCTSVPWVLKGGRESRRLINEIVLGEESDFVANKHTSHFELYLESMKGAGADVQIVHEVLNNLSTSGDISDASVAKAFQNAGAPKPAEMFCRQTFEFIRTKKIHVIASAFAFGREDLIPLMFTGFLRDINKDMGGALDTFIVYMERHIEVDGEEHGPMSLRMMAEVCGGEDDPRWDEAIEAAHKALQARVTLWDAVMEELVEKKKLTKRQN